MKYKIWRNSDKRWEWVSDADIIKMPDAATNKNSIDEFETNDINIAYRYLNYIVAAYLGFNKEWEIKEIV